MFSTNQVPRRSPQFCWIFVLILLLSGPFRLLSQALFRLRYRVADGPDWRRAPRGKVILTDQNKGYTLTRCQIIPGAISSAQSRREFIRSRRKCLAFEKTVRTGIRVDVNQNVTANMNLKVSSSSQTVEVKSQTQGLDAQDATTGLVIDRKFINDLPLIDRYVMDLTMLTPGVTETDDQCSVGCTGTNFVSNGSRNSTSDVLMDGATVTNYEPNGGVTQVTYTPSPEAVDEFRVEQSNFSAEYGFSGASVVNMITRSGSNTVHGSAYDFIRNTITDANTGSTI